MKELAAQLGLSIVATLVAWLACLAGAWFVIGPDQVRPILVAGLVSLPIGLLLVCYFYVFGVNASALVLGSLLRVSMTLGIGAAVAWQLGIWGRPFFLTLGVIYLANLALETWVVYKQNDSASKSRSSSI
ncbi:hypothetical protein [Planctomicrobium sp. SH527]|uniref:hypothetical protein n=1 Tax=Planctomicrobium sp. SH527 TaxID=3448123 RepID=UPI003F5BA30E